jgi:putative ABC transport system permease protein
MSPRWRKVLKDLWGNKARTLLAVLSIAAGVFAAGMINNAYLFLDHDMDLSYIAVHPAHGVITAEPFEDEMVEAVERLPSVEEAEGRVVLENTSIRLGPEKKHPLNVTAVEDLSKLRLDQLILVSGNWPAKMEMAVIPSRFAQVGDVLQVELPDGRVRELRVSGEVRDSNGDITGGDSTPSLHQPKDARCAWSTERFQLPHLSRARRHTDEGRRAGGQQGHRAALFT